MQVIIPKYYGSCIGSEKVINLALKLASNNVVVYKELLHNEELLEYLEKKGLKCVSEIPKNKEVIIRAHGEPKSTYEYLEKNNIKYYDSTCINVKRVQELINKYHNNGYKIVIIGKKSHPEVVAENGWCDNEALIINDIKEVKKIEGKVLVVCQTTIGTQHVLTIVNKLKELNPNIEFINTICKMQELNQKSAVEVAKQVDNMIIIGGKKSSNTKELFDVCNRICKSYLVSSKSELIELLEKNKFKRVGLTAGASTPHFLFEEYKQILIKY